jgi:hypothetical protein
MIGEGKMLQGPARSSAVATCMNSGETHGVKVHQFAQISVCLARWRSWLAKTTAPLFVH